MEEIKAELERIKQAAMAEIERFDQAIPPDELDALIGRADCAVLVNGEFLIYHTTASFNSLFGYEPGELRGEHVNKLVPEEKRAAHLDHLAAYAEHPERRSMTMRPKLEAMHKSGRLFEVKIQLVPVWPEQQPGKKYFIGKVFEWKGNE